MSRILEFFIFFVFTFSFIFMIIKTISMNYKIIQLKNYIVQIELDKKIIKDKLKIENNQDFIAFLEKSRHDAFLYIENVQSEINSFINDIGPYIEHFDKHNSPMDTHLNEGITKISLGYKKLKKLLPDNYGTIDT